MTHQRRSARYASVLLLVGGSVARTALADEPQDRADVLFQEGVAAGQQGEHERARAAFAASFALRPRGATLRNMAVAEERLGMLLSAVRDLKRALELADPQHRDLVQGELDHLYETGVGRIAVITDGGAQVELDGTAVEGTAPFSDVIDALPGPHVIVASLGARSATATVVARVGAIVSVDLQLPPEEVRLPDSLGGLLPMGTPHSPTAGSEEPVAHGSWWTPSRTAALALGAVAVVGGGIGLFFEVGSYDAAHDAAHLRESLGPNACMLGTASGCGALQDDINRSHRDATIFQVAYGVGAAAAVGALVAVILTPPNGSRSQALRWEPVVGCAYYGLRGHF